MRTNVKEIEHYEGVDGQWYWRAKAGNGEIVVPPEGHTRKEDAERASSAVFGGLNGGRSLSYCVGFPASGDNAQVEIDEVEGTITFGGQIEGMSLGDKPYTTWITIPLALWSQMVDHPSATKDDVGGTLGLYVRIAATERGILDELTTQVPLPMDGMHREPKEEASD